jgi:beta-lactamase regulating signal transducer with metallopeptidase domain
MREIAGRVSPEMMRALGWTLLHFVWQGATLAAFLAAILAFVRRADKRYALSVVALALMISAPAVTFTLLWTSAPAILSASVHAQSVSAVAANASNRIEASFRSLAVRQPAQPDVLFLFVQVWFAGVLLLSLRTTGGFILVEHLRRREVKEVSDGLRERCLALQQRLGIDRAIRYCESLCLDVPAVIGWFRPVVLLPVMALTGLTEEQLEIVIAHELAHIRRFDSFVNLFQIVAETLLFYHPAVWWVNRKIRVERENCCDDLAVATCGNAVEYARALTMMEEWRATPMLAMGANEGSLTSRVGRLLGMSALATRVRGSGLAVGLLCMAGALGAGSALLGYERVALSSNASPKPSIAASDPVKLEVRRLAEEMVRAMIKPAAASVVRQIIATPGQVQQSATPSAKAEEPTGKQSYLDQMEAAGFRNLSADDLIALKVQGVTPEYIRSMRELGFNVNVDEIVGMKTQGVTPEYVHAMRDLGFKTSADEIIGMKAMGVTEEYVRSIRALGFNSDADQIVSMKSQGITPEYVRTMQALGIKADADELIGLKAQGITPEYIHEMSSLGLATKADDLIGMKDQGVSADYVKEMQALGLKPTADDLIGMKAQGVTPDYIREMRALGLEVSGDDAIGLKAQGVTPEYVKTLQAAGLGKVTADDCVAAKAQGITPEFFESVRKHGFKDLDLEKLIALKEAGVL